MGRGRTGHSGPSASRPTTRPGVSSVMGERLPSLTRDCFPYSPAHTFVWKMPVSARAGKDLEHPLKVYSQLNLIKLQFQKPATFS